MTEKIRIEKKALRKKIEHAAAKWALEYLEKQDKNVQSASNKKGYSA